MVASDSRLEWGWLSVRQGTRKLKFVYLTAWQRTVYWVDAKAVQVLLDGGWSEVESQSWAEGTGDEVLSVE